MDALEDAAPAARGPITGVGVGSNVCRTEPRICELNALGPDWLAAATIAFAGGCVVDVILVHRGGEPAESVHVYPSDDWSCR